MRKALCVLLAAAVMWASVPAYAARGETNGEALAAQADLRDEDDSSDIFGDAAVGDIECLRQISASIRNVCRTAQEAVLWTPNPDWASREAEHASLRAWGGIQPRVVDKVGEFYFQFDEANHTAAVSDYAPSGTGDGTSVVIPETVSYMEVDYTVTKIGTGVPLFPSYAASSVKSVSIPETVQEIGPSAFRSCSALTEVYIPQNVLSIGVMAFQDCSALTEVNIPNGVTEIWGYTFYGCSSLINVNLPDSLLSIDHNAFYRCSSLTSITLPNSLTDIGDASFCECSSLTAITIPDSVASIGENAFNRCSSLTSVAISGSDAEIGTAAFEDCVKLTSVNILNGVAAIGDYAFQGCSLLNSVTISGSVTNIGYAAFNKCSALESIDIPAGVTGIGEYAFSECSSLASIVIPGSVGAIGEKAFEETNIEDIVFGGAAERWRELGVSDLPSAALVWCTDGDAVIGDMSGLMDIGTDASVVSTDICGGQVIPITVSFDRSIPEDAKLPVTIELNGLSSHTARTSEVYAELSADEPGASLDCSVTADTDEQISAAITSAGQQDYTGTPWRARVAYSAPTVSITCDATGSVIAGQSVTFTVSCGNIPAGKQLTGTLQLEGLTPADGSDKVSVRLSESTPSHPVPCTVDSGVSLVSAQMSEFQMGGRTLAITVPQLTLSVLNPSVSITSSPSGTVSEGQNVTLTVSGTQVPPQGLSGTVTMAGLSAAARDSSATFSLTPTADSEQIQCVAETGVSAASAWISQLQAGTQSLTPPPENVTLTVTPLEAVVPDDLPAEAPENPSPGENTPPAASRPQNPSPSGSASAPSSQRPGTAQTPSGGSGQTPSSPQAPAAGASSSPAVPSAPAPSDATLMPVELKPDASSMPDGVAIVENEDGSGSSLVGVEIGSLWGTSPAELIESWINGTGDAGLVRVVTPGGEVVESDQQVATGMLIQAMDGDTVTRETTIVVKGDVLGTGEISLSQVVRIAKAYTGADPLEGAYKQAGDFAGDGEIQLSDVIQEAKMYTSDTLEVDYSVADERADVAELLDTTGYDISPWTDEVAVIAADIPEGAEISSIAWTQRDVFPDGREQELYYEGPEETLIFGTYTEGRTTVTAVVTTAAGKTGTNLTEIVWGSGTSPGRPAIAAERAAVRPTAAPSTIGTPISVSTAAAASSASASPTSTASPSASGTQSASADQLGASSTASPAPSLMPAASAPPQTPGSASPAPAATGIPSASPSRTASVSAVPTQTAGASSSSQPTVSASVATSATSLPAGAPSPVDLLTTFRIEVVVGTNDLRADNDISPMLIPSTRLSEAAMVRAKEMAHAGKLSHTRPDGSKYSTVVELGKGIVIGENIHSNKGYPTPEVAQIAVHGWENSAPHRKQILEGRYTHTGIGFFESDEGKWYCVQVFSNGDKVLSIDTPKA